ncbi:BTAD domain-containing putative transcriptional regulator [Nocardiopsis sp. NPDC007018]|uniref:AfsR/SARP family transcriptional regulator n=1 Tax=Nocardiopsis sp. NPDC007018 TaxID=3155721 RepID=UPI0034059C96
MDLRILTPGPQLLVANRPVETGTPKESLILAILAESAGRIVSASTLIETVWGRRAPASVRGSLHSHVSRVRRRLREAGADAEIASRAHGYQLRIAPEDVDWHRARAWAERARRCAREGARAEAVLLLDRALGLWWGEPLTELDGPWVEATRSRMRADRARMLVLWAQTQLELGAHDEVLSRLEEGSREERFVYLRMRALAATGRTAEGIAEYNALRDRRRDEEGVEPNQETRALFQRLVEGADEPIRIPPPREGEGNPLWRDGRPRTHDTLRAGTPLFVGREKEVSLLLERARAGNASTIVQVVSGMGGVGKTTLATHVAHLLRDEFDVRLHIDLRGVTPQQALFSLLLMMGVPGERIPREPEARLALWHDRLMGRRALLVMDDAKRGQVGPLVPGTPGSVVIVTSRQILLDLEGAQRIRLDSPEPEEAVRMFAAFTGLAPETEGMDRAVEQMWNLPIALRVGAGYLQSHTSWTPAYFADQMNDSARGAARTLMRGVSTVFALSFDELSAPAQRTFLCLGLHPTSVVTDYAAAAAVGYWEEMESSIEELLDHHLVEEVSPGRFRVHDSLRDFAALRAREVMSDGERRAVMGRFLDHYLAALDHADRVVQPGRYRLWGPPPFSTSLPRLLEPKQANDWFTSVFPTVEAVLDHARRNGFVEHAARMPLAMAGLLDNAGPWDRAERFLEDAVGAWRDLDSVAGLAHALYELGCVRNNLTDAEAVDDLEAAIAFWGRAGNDLGVAYARARLGRLRAQESSPVEAMGHYLFSLSEFRRLGDPSGQIRVLTHIGSLHNEAGDFDAARAAYAQALPLCRTLGDRRMEAAALMGAARTSFEPGYHRKARESCEQALDIFRSLGDLFGATQALHNLGMIAYYLDRQEEALEYCLAAREGFRSMGATPAELNNESALCLSLVALGRAGEAERILESALHRLRTLGIASLVPQILNVLGDALVAQGRLSSARMRYQAAREEARATASPLDEGLAWNRLGDLRRLEGDEETARTYWRHAIQLLEPLRTRHLPPIILKLEASTSFGMPGV